MKMKEEVVNALVMVYHYCVLTVYMGWRGLKFTDVPAARKILLL
jgi:hypothetical protein